MPANYEGKINILKRQRHKYYIIGRFYCRMLDMSFAFAVQGHFRDDTREKGAKRYNFLQLFTRKMLPRDG